MACMSIRVADKGRYGGLKDELNNQFLFDTDAYPKNMLQALKLLQNYHTPKNFWHQNQHTSAHEGVAFVQHRKGGYNISNHDCYSCSKKGHHGKDCPDLTEEE